MTASTNPSLNNNNAEESKSTKTLKFDKTFDKDLHISKHGGWLESRFHFRFSSWNPKNAKYQRFGCLHVLNDDIIQPNSGFSFHPHRNQEIFSYILNGKLTHEDNKGNKEELSRGAFQFMSAGTGVYHSEINKDKENICRFLQIWIYPSKNELPVKYGSHSFTEKERHNQWLHAICGLKTEGKAPIQLHQDVNVYVVQLDAGKSVAFHLQRERQIYVVCAEGSVDINDIHLETRAAVRLFGEAKLNFTALENKEKVGKEDVVNSFAHLLMIEMKHNQ